MKLKVRCISYFVIFFLVRAHTHTHTWFESMVERNIFSTNSATDDIRAHAFQKLSNIIPNFHW